MSGEGDPDASKKRCFHKLTPESVTERAFSSGNSRSTWPDVATTIAPLIFSAGKQTDVDAEAEALQREKALAVTDSLN